MNGDPLFGSKFLRELYFRVDPDYSGRFTVPVLWDKQTNTIVNNESSEIIRMLNTEFNHLLPGEYAKLDLYPEHLRAEIDDQNDWVYNTVNNGVYKSGFATKQDAYESNVVPLFQSLDRLEKMLDGGKNFIAGDQLTEADVRLFTTVVRWVLSSFARSQMILTVALTSLNPFSDPLRPVSHTSISVPGFAVVWDDTNLGSTTQGLRRPLQVQPRHDPTRLPQLEPLVQEPVLEL